MEVLKSTNNTELQGLLYRKIVSENAMEKYIQGIKVHSDLVEQIKKQLENESVTGLSRSKLLIDLDKNNWEAKNFVTNYKSTRREYQHVITTSIQKLADDEQQKSIEFINHYKIAEELAKIEIFGSTGKKYPNIEHIEIINEIKKYITIIEDFLIQSKERLKTEINAYTIACLNKDVFDYSIHLQTLNKRLCNRSEYYYNQFLPIYTVELKEAKEKVETYNERALQIVEKGLDVQLKLVIDLYPEHRDNEKKLWMYYTAIKNRVNAIISELKSNPKKYKDLLHLTKPI